MGAHLSYNDFKASGITDEHLLHFAKNLWRGGDLKVEVMQDKDGEVYTRYSIKVYDDEKG